MRRCTAHATLGWFDPFAPCFRPHSKPQVEYLQLRVTSVTVRITESHECYAPATIASFILSIPT